MLTTFVPAAGPYAGQSYTLPYIKDQTKPALNLRSSTTPMAHMDGYWRDNGRGMSFIDYAEIACTFLITPDWLIGRYGKGSGNFAGMETALGDFTQSVVMGGVGIITDTLHTGSKLGGQAVSYRKASVEVFGTVTPAYQGNAPICELAVTFRSQVGYWTYSNGALVAMSF